MPPMDMPPTRAAAAALLLVCTVSTLACTRRDAPPREPQRETTVSTPPVAAPDSFLVALATSRGPVAVVVHRSWAPHGVDRLYARVHAGFYDAARFFRVARGVVVQFGPPSAPQPGPSGTSQP